ncbi:unnamed protein product [Paramecium octaurelia]|uniref:Calmodulin n=1 Tax=Paramecium octaurelia TaxID=43137 RepID=A0A8S1SZB8_PAROT|nr:unnamed protein product [Paramecium octaurelia]
MMDPAEKRMKDIKEAFDQFDTDNKGTVSTKELANILKYLGQDPTDEELDNYMRDLDPESTGTIDFMKMMKILTKAVKDDDTIDELMASFRVFDLDNTGTIQTAEMRYILMEMGEKMTAQDVKDILKEMDPDDSGMCKYVDYVKKKYEDLQVAKAKAAKLKAKKKKK